jgi:hypothetical protein
MPGEPDFQPPGWGEEVLGAAAGIPGGYGLGLARQVPLRLFFFLCNQYPRVSRAVLFVRYIPICILYIYKYCIISIYLSIYHTTHIHTSATCMRLHAHACVRLCLCVKHGHECLFDCARK